MSSFDPAGVLNGIVSVLEKVGSIDAGVVTGQGQNPPAQGVSATVWAGPIRTQPKRSGLNVVSIALEVNVRLTTPISQPPDAFEVTILRAFGDVCNALAAGFTLGGLVEQVDLLGAYSGGGLKGDPGYVQFNGVNYRCITAVVPVVLDDVWSDAP
jgi:hypothetical protein